MEITPTDVLQARQAQTREAFGIQVLRRVIDVQAQQGEELARMVAQAGGVGSQVDLKA